MRSAKRPPKELNNDDKRGAVMITLRDRDGPTYYAKDIRGPQPPLRAVVVRNSERWMRCLPLPGNRAWDIPYIDRLGRFTGHTVYRWVCKPQVALGTIISTIASRLLQYSLVHNKWHIVRKNLGRIARASFLYACQKSSWFWDRILYFCRDLDRRGNLIHKYTLKFLLKQDENIRFVYSQVCLQTNWLLSQAHRPCDKSARVKSKLPPLPLSRKGIGLLRESNYIVKTLDRVMSI